MADEDISEFLQTAKDSAKAAGKVLAERFTQERTIEYKSSGIDLVTDADKASEKALLALIRQRHPAHSILAEESGSVTGNAYRWIVDPLDGTTNYAHGIPHFCVSVALEGPTGILAGAVYDPLRDELFWAGKGKGAHLNDKPIRPSSLQTLDRSLLCTGFPYSIREKPEGPLGLFNRLIRRAQGIRRMGAAALDLAYVASGRIDGFFEFGLKAWDVAAGALLVWEGGGVMTQIDGSPLNLAIGDVMAAAAGVFPELQKECSEYLLTQSGIKAG